MRDNPFVGARPLGRDDTLFGREAEVQGLYDRLQARRIVVLHAPSGAGKSSLVEAGLIPRLLERRYDVWATIRVNLDPSRLEGVAEGTNRYALSLMVSLEEELPEERRRSVADLSRMKLLDYLSSRPRRKRRGGQAVVLVFDRFEEVLTVAPHARAEKRAFFAELGGALDAGDYWALFIVREDHLGAFAPYRSLVPTQLANTFRLDLLSRAAAREAAVGLAREGGRDFPAVDMLIDELSQAQVQQSDGSFAAEQGVHVEPVMLQVVGRRLWDALSDDDTEIGEDDVRRHARVGEALGGWYAHELQAISRSEKRSLYVERALRDWVDKELISGGIRSQVRRGAGQIVGETAGLDNRLADALKDRYLVRTDQRAGATWYELSHDRLVDAVLEDNAAWRQAHLHPSQEQARLWEEGGRGAGLLLSAGALPAALAWAQENPELVTEREREYLEVSRSTRAEEARRRRREQVFMALIVLVAVVGYVLYVQAQSALVSERNATIAAEEAKKAAEEAKGKAEKAEKDAVEAKSNALSSEQRAKNALELVEEERDAAQRAKDYAEKARRKREEQNALFQSYRRLASAAQLLAQGRPQVARLVLLEEPDHTVGGWEESYREASEAPGPLVAVFTHTATVLEASWSDDGERIFTVTEEGAAQEWSANGIEHPKDLRSFNEMDPAASKGPDSKQRGRTGPSEGTTRLAAASFSPDHTHVVTASRDGTARVWRADDGGEPVVLGIHPKQSSWTIPARLSAPRSAGLCPSGAQRAQCEGAQWASPYPLLHVSAPRRCAAARRGDLGRAVHHRLARPRAALAQPLLRTAALRRAPSPIGPHRGLPQ